MASGNVVPSITNAEHIGPDSTGDNIQAKRAAGYVWNGTAWVRSAPVGLFTLPYDSQVMSNPDAGGNYQTITSKLGGVTQEVLSLTFDGANNVTSISRA